MTADLIIKSQPDLSLFRAGLMSESEVRKLSVTVQIEPTKRFRLIVSDVIRQRLGLHFVDEKSLYLTEDVGTWTKYADAVEIIFGNRRTMTEPFVVETAFEVLIGSFLISDLGCFIDEQRQNLVVNEKHRIRV